MWDVHLEISSEWSLFAPLFRRRSADRADGTGAPRTHPPRICRKSP
ncbi:hypothetical protein Rhow_000291 [Rhodococcus wratislaviensis]|uniref:Uncharacterized protein n=1 Tax=Rhodococcus wratislaviensis TaxID=44752 RepID=A0A402CM24_RHOWR|nr:hypothetical protein Rhow_000291 [Rhodococcus wratislaviensis]